MTVLQGTPEWLKARAGHCTASRFGDALAKIKTGEAADRRNYRWQLVTERLIGAPVEKEFKSAAMQWGTDTEPMARLAYENLTGEPVETVGFLLHPSIDWCGGSPDGLLGDKGMVEFKCPEPMTHLEWRENGVCPSKHMPQVQGGLWITGREWCDFVSYDPRFPEHMRLFIVRVKRDDTYIANLEREVKKFLVEVDQLHDRLLTGSSIARAA